MRQNALLRSGRGLGLSSAARRKTAPVAIVPAVPADERDDHFAVRNGVRCAGVHLIVDLHGARHQGTDAIVIADGDREFEFGHVCSFLVLSGAGAQGDARRSQQAFRLRGRQEWRGWLRRPCLLVERHRSCSL